MRRLHRLLHWFGDWRVVAALAAVIAVALVAAVVLRSMSTATQAEASRDRAAIIAAQKISELEALDRADNAASAQARQELLQEISRLLQYGQALQDQLTSLGARPIQAPPVVDVFSGGSTPSSTTPPARPPTTTTTSRSTPPTTTTTTKPGRRCILVVCRTG